MFNVTQSNGNISKNIFHIFHTVAQFEFYTINMFCSLRSLLYDNNAPVTMKKHMKSQMKSQNTKNFFEKRHYQIVNSQWKIMITISAARSSELTLNELFSR